MDNSGDTDDSLRMLNEMQAMLEGKMPLVQKKAGQKAAYANPGLSLVNLLRENVRGLGGLGPAECGAEAKAEKKRRRKPLKHIPKSETRARAPGEKAFRLSVISHEVDSGASSEPEIPAESPAYTADEKSPEPEVPPVPGSMNPEKGSLVEILHKQEPLKENPLLAGITLEIPETEKFTRPAKAMPKTRGIPKTRPGKKPRQSRPKPKKTRQKPKKAKPEKPGKRKGANQKKVSGKMRLAMLLTKARRK